MIPSGISNSSTIHLIHWFPRLGRVDRSPDPEVVVTNTKPPVFSFRNAFNAN